MKIERRTVVGSAGTVLLSTFAGCLGNDNEEQITNNSNENDDEQLTNDGEQSSDNKKSELPAPHVVNRYYPEPRAASISNHHQTGNTYEFTVEIENTGDGGDISTMMVWLDNPNDNVYGPNSHPVPETERTRYFSSGERKKISVTSEGRDEYGGYGFRIWSAEISVEVKNEGGRGAVEIRLMDGDNVVKYAEPIIEAGATESFKFDRNFSDPAPSEVSIEVESAE
ncbi:hypothetical protein [Haloterrigena salina]|uniref:hypothetical protein n=1 Tax=Haloterrigena salina TaxID=504937 RepID=UPI0012681D44|nr:hypothetical protein [Haloterrigena salina]